MKLLIVIAVCLAAVGLFFMGRSKLITLRPFVNLKGVQDYELEVMDYKRAESEIVKENENYPKLYKGGRTGVLLIHGFTGALMSFCLWRNTCIRKASRFILQG
ncbi:MAG: hypothetical protein LRY51_04965 [Geovibrio sp.]|nr:hypothetical protein [Geovibrio sp.]